MSRRRAKPEISPTDLTLPGEGEIVELALIEREMLWTTRVEWIMTPRVCVVAPLRADGRPYPIEPGIPMSVAWTVPTGQLEGLGHLEALAQDNIATWVIEVAQVQRRQRRDAYRLTISLPVETTIEGATTPLTLSTIDLSEGGLRLLALKRSPIEVGQTLHVKFTVVDYERDRDVTVIAAGTVVRVHPRHDSEIDVHVRFTLIETETTDQIRRFIFEEQLRRRGRGG